MSPVTRRGAPSLLPAAASMGIPTIAFGLPETAVGQLDAELLRLSAAFDAAYSDWLVTWREEGRLADVRNAQWRALKLSFDEVSIGALEAIDRETGYDLASDANDAACQRLYAINDRIRAIQPKTVGGLAAWARVTRWDALSAGKWEEVPFDEDEQDPLVRFLKIIERMAGEA